MTDDSPLLAALAVIQQRGAIGEPSLSDAVAHADRFVAVLPRSCRTLVDLGSGGGLPALVIAWRRPDVVVTMVERRAARADLLRRAVSALSMGRHVRVLTCDVDEVMASSPGGFDVVTARSFADPATTIRAAGQLMVPGGTTLISEPPTDRSEQWQRLLGNHPNLDNLGIEQGIRVLRRRQHPA